jgi:hypothetical protein
MIGASVVACCAIPIANAQSENTHWAYQAPRRPSVPVIERSAWAENAIDSFTQQQMTQHVLSPSPEADRRTLIRRVTFDLTGLPPTAAEIDAFLADTAPGAYERLVDRLLQSPRFGERMATHWLDLARYADTHGYHMDAHRDMWRWRDWVIAAYNDNLTFDQFTIEQLAGDLLPDATLAQKIATGFNRNNMVNFENGVIADEFLSEYAIDRVTTTSTVWLGQTMVCARCHDHKYDPITQRDFYRMLAFFNQVPENGVDGNKGNAMPFVAAPLPRQSEQLQELEPRLAALQATQHEQAAASDAAILAWEATFQAGDTRTLSADPQLAVGFDGSSKELDDAVHGTRSFVPGKIGDALLLDGSTYVDLGDRAALEAGSQLTLAVWLFPTTLDSAVIVERTRKDANGSSYSLELEGGKVLFHVTSATAVESVHIAGGVEIVRSKWQHIAVRYDGSGEAADVSLFINGQQVQAVAADKSLSRETASKASFLVGSAESGRSCRGMIDDLRVFAHALTDEEIAIIAGGDPIGDILAVPRDERTAEQAARLRRYYLEHIDGDYRETMREIEAVRRSLVDVQSAVPTTMIMQDVAERRPTHILTNGRYDSLGELVEPGVPAILPALPNGAGANRLALARWLVEPDHPLTARVAVNHLWQLFFGVGLVRTPEDFGTRGERPTHPELLDWLATEFASDWDVKRLVRLLVTSATYRQSNRTTPELAASDPENRWLARASRLRLSAEMVRDSALYSSGLLIEQTGGSSVFPYQPDGLWEQIAYNANDFTAQVYRQSHGSDLYRRSLYTFVKRSLPSPTLAAFDAPNRETCVTQRPRTNTPQQALVLMNDVTFVEAARALAEQTLANFATTEVRINNIFIAATSRPTSEAEAQVFDALIRDLRKRYEEQPSLAAELIAAGETSADERINPTELAVWTAVANVILSLDEAITRR